MDKVWVNGQQGKQIEVNDRGLNYGDGFFLTMRVSNKGEILFFNTHLSRIEQAVLRLKYEDEHQIWQLPESQKLLLENLALQNPNKGIKLLISRGVGGRGYAPVNCYNISTVITVFDLLSNYSELQQQGLKLFSSDVKLGHQPALSGLKHLNRLEQVLIKSQSLPVNYQDWLVVDYDDNIIESSMANLFFYSNNTWFTPAISKCGVAGVMRENSIYMLLNLGFNVEVTQISIEDLDYVEHIFMTNSLMGGVSITKINNQSFEPWPLINKFNDVLGVTL